LQSAETQTLSANQSRERQAWQAIAQAAAALHSAANAILGADAVGSAIDGDGWRLLPFPSQDDNYTAIEAVKEFLNAKARAGRSDRYLQALRVSLKSFAHGRAQKPLGQITVSEIEKWLNKSQWSPRTQKGYLSDVRVLYNFCIRRGLARSNPAAAVELPVFDAGPVVLHRPAEVRAVLEFARGYDLNLCRCLAVRYFAGLRSSEATRLDESEIKEGFIEVTARKSKTRRRRLVTIQPNLAAWLALGGELPLRDFNNRYRWFTAELKERLGISWPHNVTRHSFVSYHLGQFQNAARTALEAGHTEQMTFAHYREVVTSASAGEFWNIFPL
jgi:integrase